MDGGMEGWKIERWMDGDYLEKEGSIHLEAVYGHGEVEGEALQGELLGMHLGGVFRIQNFLELPVPPGRGGGAGSRTSRPR